MSDLPPLRGVYRADVAVIGGGWTGLLTSHQLALHGVRVALLTCPQTPLPAPFATLHQPERFRRIAAFHSGDTLISHLQQLRQALCALPVLMREAELFAFARTDGDLPLLQARQQFLSSLSVPCEAAQDAGGCPFPVAFSLRSPAYLGKAAPIAHALEQTIRTAGGRIFSARAVNANARQVFADRGRVDAPRVLLCTGKPLGLAGQRNLALLETRTIACCHLDAPVPLHTVQTAADDQLCLTPAEEGVVAQWDAGRTGTRGTCLRVADFLRFLRSSMPEWPSGTPYFRLQTRPADGLPVIGQFRADGGCVLCATGVEDFLSSVLAARVLARLTLHQPIAADLVYRPDRHISRASLRPMVQTLRKARAVAAMKVSAPRCSHCRCRLRWQRTARWWGCPGCGSAFGTLGQRIGGPALFDSDIVPGQRPSW